MKHVAEIMHIVEDQKDAFLDGAINPDEETKEILWLCGVRKQQYYALGDLILMTFEYVGESFKEDMARMSAFLSSKGHLVEKRRKDVPENERDTTNWWAPVKKLGSILNSKPESLENKPAHPMDYAAMLEGYTRMSSSQYDTAYDDDDWSEGMHM